MKVLKFIGNSIYDWLTDLLEKRIHIVLLSIFTGWIFYAPPYVLTGVNGFSVNLLDSMTANPSAGKIFFYFAIVEFFGFSYFMDLVINRLIKRHKSQKGAIK